MSHNNNIQIAMLEISDQNKAVLEFYFNSAGESLYTLVGEDKADAFITDYDFPGVKEHVAKIVSETNKPVVILSVKEQEVASTIWLAKPLTAASLTNAADKIKQMLATTADVEVEAEVAEIEAVEIETEAPAAEVESSQEVNIEEEVENDLFEMLEENLQLDVNKKIQARLERSGIEALVSATSGASDETDIAEDEATSSANSHLEFSDIILDDSNNETIDEESASEVDALLEALISGKGNQKPEKNTEVKESSDDIFVDNLALDEKAVEEAQATETNKESQPVIEDSETVTNEIQDVSLDETTHENNELETIELSDASSDETDILAEGIAIEKDDSIQVEEEKEALAIDESFVIHEDVNPSDEDVYADTLEVDYADLKENNTDDPAKSDPVEETLTLELEATDTSSETEINETDTEINTSNDIEQPLEDDLFNFDVEPAETANIETEDNIENQIEDELTLQEDTNEQISVDEIDTDLDSLLKEVSIEEDSPDVAPVENKEEIIEEVSSFIDTTVQENDFSDFNKVKQADSTKDDDFNLQSLLNEVREEASSQQGNDSDGFGNDSKFEQTKAEKRWMQLCGNNKPIKSQKEAKKISFNPKKHLLKVITKQIKSVKDSEQLYRLKYNDLIIVIDNSQDSVYSNIPINTDEYAEICYSEIDPKNVKIHDLDYSEVRLYRNKIKENPDRAYSVEAFIWSTSLLTARGRLHEKTEVTKLVALKVWPNLTRLELTPHAMHIAAVMSKHPGSLLEISDWLKIKQQYVFSFYFAAHTLGMIELDSNKIKKPTFNLGKKGSKEKSAERGFLGRLLKRLKS